MRNFRVQSASTAAPGEPLQGDVWHSHPRTLIWMLLYPMASWRSGPLWGDVLAPRTIWAWYWTWDSTIAWVIEAYVAPSHLLNVFYTSRRK